MRFCGRMTAGPDPKPAEVNVHPEFHRTRSKKGVYCAALRCAAQPECKVS